MAKEKKNVTLLLHIASLLFHKGSLIAENTAVYTLHAPWACSLSLQNLVTIVYKGYEVL